ncbi:MAG: MOSC domain-containing protein [Pseudomonadota bacterium]|nr:MOSC domain-containing protein [Pseudomonadota bacterium]
MDRRTSQIGSVIAVSRGAAHGLGKANVPAIRLVVGHGVEGDAHAGATVQHLSRLALHRTAPNLRQVHLIHAELHDELAAAGFKVAPGQMGENITTRGLDLLGLPVGARLHLGAEAVIEVTGLRTPCFQLDGLQQGLMAATLGRDGAGRPVRKAGVMGIVVAEGEVRPGDPIDVEPPAPPFRRLKPV